MYLELIDTLWNVNSFILEKTPPELSRINRYIMECKCISWVIIIIHFFKELIDTLWNVNTPLWGVIGHPDRELIDTLWNVNTTIMNEFIKKVSELIDTLWNVNI